MLNVQNRGKRVDEYITLGIGHWALGIGHCRYYAITQLKLENYKNYTSKE